MAFECMKSAEHLPDLTDGNRMEFHAAPWSEVSGKHALRSWVSPSFVGRTAFPSVLSNYALETLSSLICSSGWIGMPSMFVAALISICERRIAYSVQFQTPISSCSL